MIISWNTTNQCNMYCDHCYRDAGAKADQELTTAEARKLLAEIAEAGFRIMIFSGGEPFMRADIFELLDYARQLGLRPVMGSNGTMITPEVAARLRQAGTMGVGISLDSCDRAKHDKLRQMQGAWDGALQGMANCREAGVPFQIHTTVMEWNQNEVEQLTDLAVELGAVAHHIFFLVPTGRATSIEQESLRAVEYERLIRRIMKKQQEVAIEIKPTCAPHFMRIGKQMGMDLRFSKGCLAGTSYCIISPRGDVQPCAYLNIPLGNVREQSFVKIWQDNPVLQRLRTGELGGRCGGCDFEETCGGCRARAYFYSDGDYMAEEPWCLYHRGLS